MCAEASVIVMVFTLNSDRQLQTVREGRVAKDLFAADGMTFADLRISAMAVRRPLVTRLACIGVRLGVTPPLGGRS